MFYLLLFLVLLLSGVAIIVAIQNVSAFLTDVQITLLLWPLPPLPLGILLLASLLLGALLMFLSAWVSSQYEHEVISELRDHVRALEAALTQAKTQLETQLQAQATPPALPPLATPSAPLIPPGQPVQDDQVPQRNFPPPIFPLPSTPNGGPGPASGPLPPYPPHAES